VRRDAAVVQPEDLPRGGGESPLVNPTCGPPGDEVAHGETARRRPPPSGFAFRSTFPGDRTHVYDGVFQGTSSNGGTSYNGTSTFTVTVYEANGAVACSSPPYQKQGTLCSTRPPPAGPEVARTGLERMKPVLFDGFALVNLALWGLGAQFLFRRPLAFHRAELSFAELLLYGGVVAVAGILLWTRLRRVSWRPALLALVEIALLSSIAGFVVAGDGTRLYDRTWMSIPVDKLVHFACAAVAAIGVGRSSPRSG